MELPVDPVVEHIAEHFLAIAVELAAMRAVCLAAERDVGHAVERCLTAMTLCRGGIPLTWLPPMAFKKNKASMVVVHPC